MRIVITGASGNIGTALVEHLAGGAHELVGIARRPPTQGTDLAGLVEWHAADLAEPESSHVFDAPSSTQTRWCISRGASSHPTGSTCSKRSAWVAPGACWTPLRP